MSTIRKITGQDKREVMDMMRVFYASPVVLTCGTDEIFESNVDSCVEGSPFLEGYVFEEAGIIQGYAMIARSFSTELGKPCVWLEDLYIKSEYRSLGLGKDFFEFVERLYPDAIFRLEVDTGNERAIRLYEKCGYETVPYLEMRKSAE